MGSPCEEQQQKKGGTVVLPASVSLCFLLCGSLLKQLGQLDGVLGQAVGSAAAEDDGKVLVVVAAGGVRLEVNGDKAGEVQVGAVEGDGGGGGGEDRGGKGGVGIGVGAAKLVEGRAVLENMKLLFLCDSIFIVMNM